MQPKVVVVVVAMETWHRNRIDLLCIAFLCLLALHCHARGGKLQDINADTGFSIGPLKAIEQHSPPARASSI